MSKKLTLLAVAAAAMIVASPGGVRAKTRDAAFQFRMGAGFPGDINRTQPFSVVPGLVSATTPPRAYGDLVLVDGTTNTLRGVVAGDNSATAVAFYGVTVRPFPTQQTSGGMSATFGNAAPPTTGVSDFLRGGFIFVKLPAGAAVTKGAAVYVWCAATSGSNVQGACVAAASAGNTALVSNAKFTGPADANGVAEIEFWPA